MVSHMSNYRLKIRGDTLKIAEVIENYFRGKGIKFRKDAYRNRLIIYKLGLARKLILEYHPDEGTAVLRHSDMKLLHELEHVLKNVGFEVSKLEVRQVKGGLIDEVFKKAFDAKVAYMKLKYCVRFLALYTVLMLAIVTVALITNAGFLLLLVPIALFLVLPHNKSGPVRFSINPDEVFIPILYFRYRRRFKDSLKYVKEYLPLMPMDVQEQLRMVIGEVLLEGGRDG